MEKVYGIDIACERTAYFLPFPYANRFVKVKEEMMMKILKKLLLTLAFVFCVSVYASAQTNEPKKTPPKDGKPPVVVVKEKPKPKEDKPNDDKRVKKPQAFLFRTKNENEMSFV